MIHIGDLLVPFKELPTANHELPVLTLTERHGFMPQAERFNKRLATDDTSKYKVVRRDDIAFNPYLLWAGAIAQNTIVDAGIISPLYPTFRVRKENDPRYVARLLLTEQLIAAYDKIAYGSVPRRRRSSVADFLALPVPTQPPLDEQHRIAAILDQADAIRTKRRVQLLQFASLGVSAFQNQFNPGSTTNTRLSNLCEFHSGGTPAKNQNELWNGTIPWFSPKDIKKHELWKSQDCVSEIAIRQGSLRLFPADTVVLVVRGMILAHSAPTALLRIPASINQDLKALIPKAELDPEFLAAAVTSQANWLLQRVTTSAHGTRKIDTRVLNSMPIPDVPLIDQKRFASKLHQINAQRSRVEAALACDDELFASLQSRAFKGEL